MTRRLNRLKQALRAGAPAYGCISVMPSADVAEVLAAAGFDFVFIDQEHGPGSLTDAIAQLRAVECAGATGVVRVPNRDPDYLRRVLDAGAQCVYAPMVETAEAAEAFVAACHYPPHGLRGAGGGTRASLYGWGPEGGGPGDDLLILVAVETRTGVENIERIAATPGIDGVFIGPRDLSASIGRLGQFDDPELIALIGRCGVAVLGAGKLLGAPLLQGLDLPAMIARGYRMVLVGSDTGLLLGAGRAALAAAPPGH